MSWPLQYTPMVVEDMELLAESLSFGSSSQGGSLCAGGRLGCSKNHGEGGTHRFLTP